MEIHSGIEEIVSQTDNVVVSRLTTRSTMITAGDPATEVVSEPPSDFWVSKNGFEIR